MEMDVVLLRDSSIVYSEEPAFPDTGWLLRCEGLPFEVFPGQSVLALRREILRRRLFWLAACDLDVDELTVRRLYRVEEDAAGCLRLVRAAQRWPRPSLGPSRLSHGPERSYLAFQRPMAPYLRRLGPPSRARSESGPTLSAL